MCTRCASHSASIPWPGCIACRPPFIIIELLPFAIHYNHIHARFNRPFAPSSCNRLSPSPFPSPSHSLPPSLALRRTHRHACNQRQPSTSKSPSSRDAAACGEGPCHRQTPVGMHAVRRVCLGVCRRLGAAASQSMPAFVPGEALSLQRSRAMFTHIRGKP